MKRQVIAAMMIGAVVLMVGCSGGAGQQTEAPTETGAGTETETETVEASADEGQEKAKRPDYKALDYVTLGEYKGLEVTLTSLKVSDEEIDSEVRSALSQNDKLETLEEGTVQEGDVANIDYEGKKDGEAFEGGTDKGFDLTIGSHSFIDGFEEGLIGVEVGETVDLNLTFPENYSEELAGQDVVFTVTVNSIKRAPELTDELAAEISDYETAEEYRESIRNSLAEQKKTEQESAKRNDLVGLAYQNATINDYPEELIQYQLDVVTDYYKDYAAQSGMEYEEFLDQQIGMSEEDFLAQMRETVKQSMSSELVLRAIAETEKVEVSDEEFRTKAEEYAAQSGQTDVDAFIEQYGKAEIMASIYQDRAVEILEENAVVIDPDAEPETESESSSEAE